MNVRQPAGCAIGLGLVLTCVAGTPAPAAGPGCGDWSLVEAPANVIAVTDVAARSADEAWAFGSYEGLIRWDGSSWSVFPIGDFCSEYDPAWIEVFGLVGPSHLFLSGRGNTGPFSNDQILRIWDGTSWGDCHSLTLQPDIMGAPRNGAPNVIVGAAIDDAWILGQASAFGDGTSGQLLLTVHWDGSELTEVLSPGPGNSLNTIQDAVVFASDDIIAVGQYRTLGAGTPSFHAGTFRWNGTSWNTVPNPAETLCCQSTDLNTVAGVAPDDVWAAGGYGAEPLFLHWDGSSWTIVPGPATTGTIQEMVAIASDDVWAVDSPATVGAGKFYHWDGVAWSIVPGQEIPGAVSVSRHGGLAAVGPCDLWAVGSYDFGSNPVLPLIERLQPGVTTAVPSLAPGAAALEVFPNPIRESARIRLASPGSAVARAEVYDVRGRRIRTLPGKSMPGEELLWDGRDDAAEPVPAGIYFLRVKTVSGEESSARLTVVR